VVARHARRHRIEQSRVTMVRGYAELQGCRRQYLLNYLGEDFEAPCGGCDNCLSGRTLAQQAAAVGRAAESAELDRSVNQGVHGLPGMAPPPAGGGPVFAMDDEVRHARWGAGRVVRVEPDRVVVLFDDVGYKTLATPAVVAGGLLTRVA
jgi:ATP-dependent DNA helicase RecQ